MRDAKYLCLFGLQYTYRRCWSPCFLQSSMWWSGTWSCGWYPNTHAIYTLQVVKLLDGWSAKCYITETHRQQFSNLLLWPVKHPDNYILENPIVWLLNTFWNSVRRGYHIWKYSAFLCTDYHQTPSGFLPLTHVLPQLQVLTLSLAQLNSEFHCIKLESSLLAYARNKNSSSSTATCF